MSNLPEEFFETLWEAIVEVRDAYPRSSEDAPTGLVIEAIEPLILQYVEERVPVTVNAINFKDVDMTGVDVRLEGSPGDWTMRCDVHDEMINSYSEEAAWEAVYGHIALHHLSLPATNDRYGLGFTDAVNMIRDTVVNDGAITHAPVSYVNGVPMLQMTRAELVERVSRVIDNAIKHVKVAGE